jgi:hypothetical protein
MQTAPSSQDPAIPILQNQMTTLLAHTHDGVNSLQLYPRYFHGVQVTDIVPTAPAEGGTWMFFNDGTHPRMYAMLGGSWVNLTTQLIAGTGISLSPSNGMGQVTVTATSTHLTNVRGGDTATLNSHSASTTHTITHGLGRTVTMIKVWATLTPNGVPGANTDVGYGIGEIMLDASGNILGGLQIAFYSGSSGVYGNSLQVLASGSGQISASTETSGGVANMSITANNVTSTTFDIVYTVSDNGGAGAPTQNFTANWMVM